MSDIELGRMASGVYGPVLLIEPNNNAIFFGSVTALQFFGDGSQLTGIPDNDTLAALAGCTNGQVAKYDGSAWTCAAEAEPAFTGFQTSGGTLGGDVSVQTTGANEAWFRAVAGRESTRGRPAA